MALEPVEIDIRMKQNVSEEADKASRGLEHLSETGSSETSAMQRVLEKLGYAVGSAGKSLGKLRKDIKESRAAIREMEALDKSLPALAAKQTGAQKGETLAEWNAVKKALEEEKLILNELEQQLDTTAEASKRLTAQKAQMRDEMARLKIAGKEDTEEYRQLAEAMQVVEGALQEVNTQTSLLGKKDGVFRGIIGGLAGVSGALTAGAGASALFGGKSENLEEVQTRLQSLMSITMGLQETYNMLQETSALRTVVLTKAKKAWTAAQTALNTQLGISVGLSKALMIGGIGLLIGGITVLVMWYQKWRKEQEEINAAKTEGIKNAQEEIVKVKALESVLKNSNNEYAARRTALDKLQEIMPGYNAMLSREGELIEDNTGALKKYIEQVKNAEMAKVYARKMAEAQGEYEDFLLSLGEGKGKIIDDALNNDDPFALAPASVSKHMDKATKLFRDVEKYNKKLEGYLSGEFTGEAPEEGSKAYWQQQQRSAQALLETMTDLEKGSAKWNEAVGRYNEATEKLKAWDIEGANKDRGKMENKAGKARRELREEELKGQISLDALILEAMEEGAKKRLKQAENEQNKELEMIRLKREDIARLEAEARSDGKFTKEDEAYVASLKASFDKEEAAAQQKYAAAVKRINESSKKAIQEVWDSVYDNLRSDLARSLAEIERSYAERAEVITQETTDTAEREIALAKLTEAKERDIRIAITRNRMKTLDTEEDIALERQKLANKRVIFETDREKKLLEISKEYAEKRLAYMKQLQQEGVEELKQEIEDLEAYIASLSAGLSSLNTAGLQEKLSALRGILTTLGELEGDAGQFFSGLGQSVEGMLVAFSETATLTDKITAGIGGIVDIVGMLSSASARRKEAEREFYQNAIALAHEYALALNEQLRLQSELSGSGFVNNYQGKINDGFAALADATAGYNDALSKLSEGRAKIDLSNAVDWGSVGKGIGGGAAAGAVIGSVIPGIGTAIGAIGGAIIGGIVGLFGGRKKKDEYAGLLEVFPELIDGTGKLNVELAQTLINTNQVDEETKQILQNLLDWSDAVDAANEQIKAVVVDLAGDLGNSLKNSIVDAWKAGEDASRAMFDAAGKSLEGFVENLLFSTIFADIFDLFAERLAQSLNPNGGDMDVLDDFDWLMQAFGQRDEAYLSFLEALKNRAKEKGFNLWEDEATSSRTGASRGLESISQDSADKIEGGVYALRITANNIENLSREQRDILSAMTSALDRIADNTEYCRYLKEINDVLTDFQMRGVRIR
ncbi:MAG: hypothetical protein LBQ73_02255 [Tannerellaceae bacterium]|jgi:hypothetical protein|nr:hypothetical protein [Tannerellaceae bacterium]